MFPWLPLKTPWAMTDKRRYLIGALTLAGVLVILACGGASSSNQDLTGEEIATEVGCFACHGDTDTDVAPTLNGIWGTEVTLEDGRIVTVDEVYVRKSITEPGADIVDGFDARMPTFSLTETEIDRLVDYVRSLG